jgi:hypothetical protein
MNEIHHIDDLDFLEIAFEDNSGNIDYLFDKETGEIISFNSNMSNGEILEEALKYADESDREDLENLKADPYIVFSSNRFVSIDPPPSYKAYNLMVEFAEEQENEELFRLLEIALNGRGAFRRFKDELLNYPKEQEMWFKFKRIDTLKNILEWSKVNNIKIIGVEELIDSLS